MVSVEIKALSRQGLCRHLGTGIPARKSLQSVSSLEAQEMLFFIDVFPGKSEPCRHSLETLY